MRNKMESEMERRDGVAKDIQARERDGEMNGDGNGHAE